MCGGPRCLQSLDHQQTQGRNCLVYHAKNLYPERMPISEGSRKGHETDRVISDTHFTYRILSRGTRSQHFSDVELIIHAETWCISQSRMCSPDSTGVLSRVRQHGRTGVQSSYPHNTPSQVEGLKIGVMHGWAHPTHNTRILNTFERSTPSSTVTRTSVLGERTGILLLHRDRLRTLITRSRSMGIITVRETPSRRDLTL
jgi:hypothetical protein